MEKQKDDLVEKVFVYKDYKKTQVEKIQVFIRSLSLTFGIGIAALLGMEHYEKKVKQDKTEEIDELLVLHEQRH